MREYRTFFISRRIAADPQGVWGIAIGNNKVSAEEFASHVQTCIERQEQEQFELFHTQAAKEVDVDGLLAIFGHMD